VEEYEKGDPMDALRLESGVERDPMTLAEILAKEYARHADLYEAPGGTRDVLNQHLQESFRIIFFYNENPEKFDVFGGHPYFSDIGRKPTRDSIARSVLIFTMQAKRNEWRLNRIYKCARVMEQFLAQGVVPDHVASLLKESGGVDQIYENLCEMKKIRYNAAATAEVDNELREVAAVGTANHIGQLKSPKRRRLNIRDLETELIVEFDPQDLARALASSGGLIRFKPQLADERGWKRVLGEIERLDLADD
jgi:hypothetical protein